ncbi:histidine phosphotransferase family protein [Kordiimonas sp. SCSIO 12610]|uniref:histidine phosphotransferase family protein n=1 Tax=Kordiimonas sp. SCSIO 12610 TaxID=2829597 RepID=UPI00210AF005|nr:histidine phosphotransferase family protein [Kordiimonas sp. SCSIO 12610]UTW54553.1 histidine phosphotransferase [Kordiimonas sp. SCSIO 12610]
MSKIDFAALLCSRLCHDLVSPVGAITNGIEILEDEHDADMREQVVDLLKKSAVQTSNKLQFFRLAFGAGGGFSAQLDLKEAEKALLSFVEGARVNLTWQTDVYQAPKAAVKVLLNLSLVGAETLIRGGDMTVTFEVEDDEAIMSMKMVGDKIILQDSIKTALAGDLNEDDLEPRTAPAFLASNIVFGRNGNVSVDDSIDGELTISAKLKINA